jgi:hypothetical protein
MRVAKLVMVSLMTRVIVDDNLTEEQELEQIAEQAKAAFVDKIMNDGIGDHLESIEDDEECPFGTFESDK